MTALTRYRWLCFAGLGAMVALGISKTVYGGWGYASAFGILGDVLYEMAWIWFVGAWRVHWRVKWIAISTFLITSLIEISQLIPFPETWISQLWWRLLLGTHFSWLDFVYYAVGCLLGGLSLNWLRQRSGVSARAIDRAAYR
ncbi:MAG: DUF2809 domain-containing protein [Cyanobacteria bacterium P01_D01_bin.36]